MSAKSANIVLLVVLVLVIGTVFTIRRDYSTRNVEFLPGMVSHVAYGPQSANPNFPDGKTLQRPVEGTVVRGFEQLSYKATPQDALRAGLELSSPLDPKDSTADIARGKFVFGNMCKPCHGATGVGDGVISQRGHPPPPSLFAENAIQMRDGQIFHIITHGQRNMPSLEVQVVREDRWRVVKYIRSLQEGSKQGSVAMQ